MDNAPRAAIVMNASGNRYANTRVYSGAVLWDVRGYTPFCISPCGGMSVCASSTGRELVFRAEFAPHSLMWREWTAVRDDGNIESRIVAMHWPREDTVLLMTDTHQLYALTVAITRDNNDSAIVVDVAVTPAALVFSPSAAAAYVNMWPHPRSKLHAAFATVRTAPLVCAIGWRNAVFLVQVDAQRVMWCHSMDDNDTIERMRVAHNCLVVETSCRTRAPGKRATYMSLDMCPVIVPPPATARDWTDITVDTFGLDDASAWCYFCDMANCYIGKWQLPEWLAVALDRAQAQHALSTPNDALAAIATDAHDESEDSHTTKPVAQMLRARVQYIHNIPDDALRVLALAWRHFANATAAMAEADTLVVASRAAAQQLGDDDDDDDADAGAPPRKRPRVV